jgi:AmiR/NasT family two-component response regulator
MDRLRIFIADDESIIRIDLREMLTEMGHEVVGEATTGGEAVRKIEELDPDLVFLDIKMPVMDGLEALSKINEQKLYPVIILTAFSQKDLIEKAVKLGAKAYVLKPFRSAVLEPAIQMALVHFRELKVLREENATLKETIELSKLINKAKGFLMEHEKLSEQEAFRKMQKLSMDRNKKMKEVAEALILVYENVTVPGRPS